MKWDAIVFLLIFTLHNAEEALWLPRWMQKNMPDGHGFISVFTEALRLPNLAKRDMTNNPKISLRDSFLFADLGITVLGYLSVGLFIIFPYNQYVEYVYIGFVGAMLINAIVPHLLLTIRYRKYCPGVFTGCLLFIPFNTVILINATKNYLQISKIIVSTIFVGIILVAMLPVFSKLAGKLLDF